MSLGKILSDYAYVFILIMLRYNGLFLLTPILSSGLIVNRLKIAFSFFLALITVPLVTELYTVEIPGNLLLILADILKELSIGLIMGFIVLLIFSAIQLAGQYIDMRMAFRLANAVNPLSNSSTPVVGQFQNILATLLFLTINGHHILIHNIHRSFEIIPPGEAVYINGLFKMIFRASGDMFLLSFKIALPIIGTIFLVDVILGFLARAVPQMNLFIIGLPVKILVGFIFLILTVGIMVNFYNDVFNQLFRDLERVLKLFTGG